MRLDWNLFAKDLLHTREGWECGLRNAASEAGISHSTWSRAENGKPISAEHFLMLCHWMNASPLRYLEA